MFIRRWPSGVLVHAFVPTCDFSGSETVQPFCHEFCLKLIAPKFVNVNDFHSHLNDVLVG